MGGILSGDACGSPQPLSSSPGLLEEVKGRPARSWGVGGPRLWAQGLGSDSASFWGDTAPGYFPLSPPFSLCTQLVPSSLPLRPPRV